MSCNTSSVDGKEEGEGTGRSVKEAKEEAAQSAFKAMKWDQLKEENKKQASSASAPPIHLNLSGQPTHSVGLLALFNQMAAQRRFKVDWPATMSGEAHSVSWHVKCLGMSDVLMFDNGGFPYL